MCGPDTVWQREFEEMFPYEETEDQLAALRMPKGYGEHQDHGPANLWRCRIWKNRGSAPGSLQGGTGEQTGGISGTYHHSGSADL